MTVADLVAIVLLFCVTLYAVLSGADFGAGFWDLLAGGASRGARPRALIERAIGPVYEVNHVWLIFCLVVLWTAFGPVFASIMTTLSIPLSLAALGIVLRGSGFAFRHEAERLSTQRLFGAIFAISSVLTPFFLGTVVGGIVSNRVPVGNAVGNLTTSWLNPTSMFTGALAVATSAYLAAVFLVTDAHRLDADELETYFRRRALWSAACAGLLALIGIFVLRAEAPVVARGLADRGWPLMVLSGLCGTGALVLLRKNVRRATRLLAAGAVAAVIWGWGVAQYPYLLPDTLTIANAAGATATLLWLVAVVAAAVVLVVPPLIVLFRLDQQSRLESHSVEVAMSQNGSLASVPGDPHVVIVGGGFGGVAAARALKHAPVSVTLIDRVNYHLFQPLLYQVASGLLEPGTIAPPIRSLFGGQENVEVRMAEVSGVDEAARHVVIANGRHVIPYDYLILATGVQGSYFGHDEWAPLAPGLKTLSDAEALRRQIVGVLERAEEEEDPQVRQALLTFVLVGAGPTGCELAGALADLLHRTLRAEFRHIDLRTARIILVEAGPRALAPFSEQLARGVTDKLTRMGVEVRAGHPVELVDADGVVIADERVAARTVLWTAGVRGSPAGTWLETEMDRAGRVVVGPDLTIPGYPEIFVVGDTAHVEKNGRQLPGVAQVALQSGHHAGHTIRARVTNKQVPGPFKYLDKGTMATISPTYAIIEMGPLRFSGLIGKLGWAFIHFLYLGQGEDQLLLAVRWLFASVSGARGSLYIDAPQIPPGQVQVTADSSRATARSV